MRSALTQQSLFLHVLDLWHAGRIEEAQGARQALAPGTPEAAASDVLLDPRPWQDKVEQIRARLQGDHGFLLGFLAAEHLLKAGLGPQAREAFGACLAEPSRDGEELLRMRARARLLDLAETSP